MNHSKNKKINNALPMHKCNVNTVSPSSLWIVIQLLEYKDRRWNPKSKWSPISIVLLVALGWCWPFPWADQIHCWHFCLSGVCTVRFPSWHITLARLTWRAFHYIVPSGISGHFLKSPELLHSSCKKKPAHVTYANMSYKLSQLSPSSTASECLADWT